MATPPRPRIGAWPRGRDAGVGSGLEPLGPEEHRDSRGHRGWPGHPGPPEPVCRETYPVFPRSIPAPATETGRRAGGRGCPLRPGRPAETSLWAAGSARPSAPCVRLWPAGSTSPCAVRRSGLSKDRRNESTAKPGEERSARRVTGVSTGGRRRAGRAQAGSRAAGVPGPRAPLSVRQGTRSRWDSGVVCSPAERRPLASGAGDRTSLRPSPCRCGPGPRRHHVQTPREHHHPATLPGPGCLTPPPNFPHRRHVPWGRGRAVPDLGPPPRPRAWRPQVRGGCGRDEPTTRRNPELQGPLPCALGHLRTRDAGAQSRVSALCV